MLRVTREDVERFAARSGDRNPLHVSPEYARATAFGQPIAHGVLGLLSAARLLPDRRGKGLRKIAVEFPRPMLRDTDYAVEVSEDEPDVCALEVRDGSKPVLRGVLEFGEPTAERITPVGDSSLRATAATHREFARGQTVGGRYGPSGALEPLRDEGIGLEASALMLCSYVIGMELPGELALFTRLALDFQPCQRREDLSATSSGGELSWEARVEGWQPRTGALRIGIELRLGGEVWAKGSLRAFVRTPAAADTEHELRSDHLDPRAFVGKTAVVIGASRGLGRWLALGFAAHGGRTFAVSRSPGPAVANLITLQADAADPEQLGRALEPIERVDLLVCNASPPLQPLTLEPATATRVRDHIHQATALVAIPLSLSLPRLAQTSGVALLSSSTAVVAPPTEWAHYVAGKRAAEGLFEVAAAQYPSVDFLVARMPRLDTAYSLNVSGEPAASARSVALRLLERIAAPSPGFAIMSSFDPA